MQNVGESAVKQRKSHAQNNEKMIHVPKKIWNERLNELPRELPHAKKNWDRRRIYAL